MSNQEHYEKLIEAHNELYADIYSVVETMCNFKGFSAPDEDLEDCNVYVGSSGITVEWEEYYGGCGGGTEGRSVNFPTKYLWDSEWEREERQRRLEANLKAIADRKAKEQKAKQQAKLREYKQYLELREKFGDIDPLAEIEDNSETV